MVLLFSSALGEYDLSIYDELGEEKKFIGIGFHVVFLACNLLLLLNLIIALMADTYQKLADVKLGLYSQEIIEAIPSYKNDKFYGGLISMTPPTNMFAYFLLPFYMCIKDKARLQRFNTRVCKVVYFPIGLTITAFFLASSLVMTPFAYFKVVIHKFALGFRQRSPAMHAKAFLYLIFGVPLLVVTAITDSVWFLRHLYLWNIIKV